MDENRKYRQRGYQDTGRPAGPPLNRENRAKGPRPPIDVTGPRLPRLVQSVTASRCYNCAVPLAAGADFKANCPKCGVSLHCCKQCAHFEPSTRFQCRKPVVVRIAAKDQSNDCELFEPRVTVARDIVPVAAPAVRVAVVADPRSPQDARAAFDNLFKK
jgi:hypothetical protein